MVRAVIKASLILCFSYAYDNKVTVRTGARPRYVNSIMERCKSVIRARINKLSRATAKEIYANCFLVPDDILVIGFVTDSLQKIGLTILK